MGRRQQPLDHCTKRIGRCVFDKKARPPAGVGGNPIRSNVARRISVTLSAGARAASPVSLQFLRGDESIHSGARLAFLFRGWKAQTSSGLVLAFTAACCQGAPASIHWNATFDGLRRTILPGGIFTSPAPCTACRMRALFRLSERAQRRGGRAAAFPGAGRSLPIGLAVRCGNQNNFVLAPRGRSPRGRRRWPKIKTNVTGDWIRCH